ncbi:MAG TPA: hypothetical protein DCX37_11995, partial [Firmicutes bacterium]|nr:hypothetical protein [Bacillota bacterium]
MIRVCVKALEWQRAPSRSDSCRVRGQQIIKIECLVGAEGVVVHEKIALFCQSRIVVAGAEKVVAYQEKIAGYIRIPYNGQIGGIITLVRGSIAFKCVI